jgi:hypothetical protein
MEFLMKNIFGIISIFFIFGASIFAMDDSAEEKIQDALICYSNL